MEIIISNSSDKPIYEQICMQVKSFIMDGTLSAGEALPSMRALAKDLHISVITVQRAAPSLGDALVLPALKLPDDPTVPQNFLPILR